MTSTSAAAQVWGLRIHVLSYFVASLIQVVVWWVYTPDHFFWPLWSIVSWPVGLWFHARVVRSQAPARVAH